MLGSIIGHILGENYGREASSIKSTKDIVNLLSSDNLIQNKKEISEICAIYDAIINGDSNYSDYLEKSDSECDDSIAAMRVTPIGFCFDQFEQIEDEAKEATIPTHDTDDAKKGSKAVALSIYLLRIGMPKRRLEDYMKLKYYSMNYELEELQEDSFSKNDKETVPYAMVCFFKSNSFENAIANALSIGGDSSTITSITTSLAEAYYGIPEKVVEKSREILDDDTYNLLKDKYFSSKVYRIRTDNRGQYD